MNYTRPLVSVIIPVYNDEEGLRITLEALNAQSYPKGCYEVIVVDNASDRAPVDLVQRYRQARLVEERQPGSYAARNRGIEVSVGEILAFTDADCRPAEDWIEKGSEWLDSHPQAGLIGGRFNITCADPEKPSIAEMYELLTAFNQKAYVRGPKFSCTGNMFTRRATIQRVGLFCTTLKSGGDFEWGRRVHEAGFELIYAEDVIVAHPARATVAELCKKRRRVIGGLYVLARQCHTSFNPLARGWWDSATYMLTPNFRRSVGLARHSELNGITERLKILGIDLLLQLVARDEEIRLRFGKISNRS